MYKAVLFDAYGTLLDVVRLRQAGGNRPVS